jgi:hypothetical protein
MMDDILNDQIIWSLNTVIGNSFHHDSGNVYFRDTYIEF